MNSVATEVLGAGAPVMADASDIIDLQRYPIADLSTAGAREVLAEGKAQLAKNGLCLLPDFLHERTLAAMVREAMAHYPEAHFDEVAQTDDGSGRLQGFALPRPSRTASSAVSYDRLAVDSPIRRLYESDILLPFFRELLGVPVLYRCADPFISCLLMYYSDGDELGWHFDPNDGVVTLLLQEPEVGGKFEFVPDIRRDDEASRVAVAEVMDGSRDAVVTPDLRPGTLSLFQGSNSLHRVTKAVGPRPRIILTLSYDTQPGTQFSAEIRRRYAGRTA